MVRLKVQLVADTEAKVIGFNSNMVRLKAALQSYYPNVFGFQFQYGTIKRTYHRIAHKQHIVFQFQYGTIKSISIGFIF